MAGKVILKTELSRESGFLYYCGTDSNTGNLTICQTKMARGKKKTAKKKDVSKKATSKKTVKKKKK